MPDLNLRQQLASNPRFVSAAQRVRDAVVAWSAPTEAHRAWRAIDGEHTLRLDYDLGPESVVLDVGGFAGQWTSDIVAMYGCRVHVFEPVPAFAERVAQRFARNPLVTIHRFALADSSGAVEIEIAGAASSHVKAGRSGSERIMVPVRSADEVVTELHVETIDLMKVNIEGAEFALLAHLIDTALIRRINDLQIQFHPHVENARPRADALRARLSGTHECTWAYDFVWENWRRRT